MTVNPGSEPFALGLRAIGDAAWEMLNARGVEWAAIGSKTGYAYRVHSYTASPGGIVEDYVTTEKAPKQITLTPYQRTVLKMAKKTRKQFCRNCDWVYEQFTNAIENPNVNGRVKLRCLTGRAKFEALVKDRLEELEARIAGKESASNPRLLDFAKRHGQVHVYRDNLYASAKEAQAALFEDTKAVPVDHDLIVMMYEEAFPPGAFDEAKWDDVVRYMASKAHRDALAMSEEMGATTGNLSRHDKTVNRVLNAERKLAALTDPLPPSLHEKLGIDRETFRLLMKGKVKNRPTVREALREWLYQLCPSRRPRKKTSDQKGLC
jgi:hypothetical protein